MSRSPSGSIVAAAMFPPRPTSDPSKKRLHSPEAGSKTARSAAATSRSSESSVSEPKDMITRSGGVQLEQISIASAAQYSSQAVSQQKASIAQIASQHSPSLQKGVSRTSQQDPVEGAPHSGRDSCSAKGFAMNAACTFTDGRPSCAAEMNAEKVPEVLSPSEFGLKVIRSLRPPEIWGTEKLPVVESRIRPSGKTKPASSFSEVLERPTSLPSKWKRKMPAVHSPSEIGTNLMRSLALKAPPGPGRFPPDLVEMTMHPSSSTLSEQIEPPPPVSPTSLPSK